MTLDNTAILVGGFAIGAISNKLGYGIDSWEFWTITLPIAVIYTAYTIKFFSK